jgi:translation initiation factor 2 subunit 1
MSGDELSADAVAMGLDAPDGKPGKAKKASTLARFRFYEAKYPEVEDFVMVEVKRIEEMGAYVLLKEYDDQEGMILLSELSRRRIRSIHKIIRVGRLEVVCVLRVDKEKGYIDVSKRRVTPEDVAACEEKYNKAKAVHLIVSAVAQHLYKQKHDGASDVPTDAESEEEMRETINDVYTRTAWPLYKAHGHAYDAFKVAVSEPEQIFGTGECGELLKDRPDVKEAMITIIRERMSPKAVKIRADVEVTCSERAGIEAIKDALRAGQGVGTEEIPIDVKLIAAPLYVLTAMATDKTIGLELVENAVEAVRTHIKKSGGNLTVKQETRLVKEADDLELAELMAKLSKKQMGDDSDSDSDGDSESDSESDE